MLSRALLIEATLGVKILTDFASMFHIPIRIIKSRGSGVFVKSVALIV